MMTSILLGLLSAAALLGIHAFLSRYWVRLERRQASNQKSLQLLERVWGRLEQGNEEEIHEAARVLIQELKEWAGEGSETSFVWPGTLAPQEESVWEEWVKTARPQILSNHLISKIDTEVISLERLNHWLKHKAFLADHPGLVMALNSLKSMLEKMNWSLCVPVAFGGNFYGLLTLSLESRGMHFSRHQDLRLLSTAAGQLAMLLHGRHLASERLRAGQLGLLGQMLGAFSEQMKGPLTNIHMTCENYMENHSSLPPEEGRGLEGIMSHATLMAEMIHHLRDFNAFQKSKPGRVSVVKVLEQSLHLLDHQIRRKAIQVYKHLDADSSPIVGDGLLLNIVFSNMIRNAVQAMGQGGSLTVGVRQEEDSVVIHFQDTGTGISQQHLKKIFDRFFTTKGQDGMGIGLAFSRQIVAMHGGHLIVQSQAGQGSHFMIRLPAAEAYCREEKAAA